MAGVGQTRKPGSMQIITYPFTDEKPAELQVHSEAITRMCLNYDHT